MKTTLNNMNISTKLGLCFLAILLFSVAFSGYSILSQKYKFDNFVEYRNSSKQTILLGELLEDTLEARLAVMKYRINTDATAILEVNSNIQEILDQEKALEETITDSAQLEILSNNKVQLNEYADNFNSAVSEFSIITDLVRQLDNLGPSIRKNISTIMETAYSDGDPVAAYYGGQTVQHVLLARLYASKYIISNNPDDAVRFGEESQKTIELFDRLIPELQNQERLTLANKSKSAFLSYVDLFNEVVEASKTKNELLTNRLDILGPQILQNFETVLDQSINTQNELGPLIIKSMSEMINQTVIASILMTAMGVFIALFFGKYLSSNLKRLTNVTKKLSSGDTSVEIDSRERKDEIGQINNALQVFKKGIIKQKGLEEEARKNAEKAEAEKIELMNNLANSFESRMSSIVQAVSSASSQLDQTASGMLDTITRSGDRITQSSDGASKASANVQSVATAAEEMSATGHEISQQVIRSSKMVDNSVVLTCQADKQAAKLNEATNKVSAVVRMIADIASEINLLALNATIESARAGEAGKGFAVVANEVKNLASQTDRSIQEIEIVIKEMVKASSEIIGVLEEINKSVDSISETSSTITSAINQQSQTTTEIVQNMHVAAQGTQAISDNLHLVHKDAKTSQSAATQVTHAADELKKQATGLEEEVCNFLKEVRTA